MGDTQEGEAVAETNVAQVVPAVTSEDADEEPAPEPYDGPEYADKIPFINFLTNYPCAVIGLTIGVSTLISFGLALGLQYGGPEPSDSDTAILGNLFYVAGWDNVTSGYDPDSVIAARADGYRVAKTELWLPYVQTEKGRRLLTTEDKAEENWMRLLASADAHPVGAEHFPAPTSMSTAEGVEEFLAATSDRLNSPLRSVMRERARQREMGNARTDRSGRQRRALQGGRPAESDGPEVQQSKRFHIMYGLFQSVETTNGGLLNEANIVKMKELEDKIVKHAEFPNFCKFKSLHVDANGDKFYGRRTAANGTTTWCQPSQPDTACKATCQPPMTITNYFYPRATLTASVLKDSALFTFLMALTGSPRAAFVTLTQMRNSPVFNVKARGTTAGAALMQLARYKKIVSDLSATTGKGVDASDAYDVVICKAKTASAACKATVGCAWTSAACGPNAAAILASKFARVIATSDGTGPKVDIPVMANLLGQFYQNDGMKPYLDFFFDKDFSASIGTTPTNIWTRNFFSFGAPLAGYASKGDNRAAQNTAFVDWFQTNFRDEFEAQVDQDAGINMYYLNSAAMQDEIITILTHDALMALFSVFVVMLWMWFQTGYSVLIATMGMIEICMSLPMAVFFYRVVFGFMYFDFLNMLVLYIILAIGADDVFIWVDAYKQSAYQDPIISSDLEARMSWAWRRAAYAMFATSCTTCGAFLATAFSPLLELQSFGIYAALVIFLDYIYVITWLPAATVVWHHAFEGRAPCACDCTACFCPPKAKSEEMKPLVQKTEMRPLEKFYDTTFTDFVTGKASYVMVAVGSLFLLVALILAPQVEPSIAQDELLPADHPFQVVIDSSKYFPASGAGAKIMSVVIFGMNPIDRSETGMRLRNPDEQGAAQYDPAFNWNSAATQRYFNKTCAALSAETWVTTEKDKERVDCLFQTINHWVDQQKPTGIKKLPQEGSDATKTLVAWALSSDRPAGEELVGLSSGCGDGSGPATDLSNCRVQYVAIQAATPLQPRRYYTSSEFDAVYSQAEAFVTRVNTASDKPASAGPIFQTTDRRKWVEMSTQVIRVETAIRSVLIAVGLAMVALLIFTHNFIAAGFATLTIGCVCSCILAGMVVFGSRVGDTESICLIILAGFCVDYIVHLGHAYMESEHVGDRKKRVHDALRSMGVSVLSGAITSIGASSVLTLCHLQFFSKFGIFFFSTIMLAWLWASLYFMPLMALVGPENDTAEIGAVFRMLTGGSSEAADKSENDSGDKDDDSGEMPDKDLGDKDAGSDPETPEITKNPMSNE